MSGKYPAQNPPPSRPMSMVPPAGPASTMGVAFLGAATSEVGAMAAPMATNIAKKGFPIAVWNRSQDRSAALAALGAKLRGSPRECVQGARVVILLLDNEASVFDVLERADGVLAGIEKDAVIVDMSTIGRAAALKASELAKAAGARFIDSPVSGSIGHAERGELTALVGGRLNDVSRAQPVIQSMTKKIIHAGDVGQGQALKIILNALGAHQLAAFTSMLVLGERAGLARRVVIDAFTNGVFAAPSYVSKREKMLAKDYSPELTLAVGLKEAQLNIELQQEVGLPLPVQREITRALEKAVEDGLGEEDLYALEKYYRAL